MTSLDVQDGRAARSVRTRLAVVQALLDLLREGNLRPTAQAIADRAGVSLRSVYVHFDDLEDLFAEAAAHHARTVLSQRQPIARDQPLEGRITDTSQEFAGIHEATLAVRRAATLQEPFSPTLAATLAYTRRLTRDEMTRVFGTELDTTEPSRRRRLLAALCVAVSSYTWEVLRLHEELDLDEARAVVAELLGSILKGAR